MSSLTTTTINTANSSTDITLTTGNINGPSLIVTSGSEIHLRANATTNSVSVNTSSLHVNTASTLFVGNVNANNIVTNSVAITNGLTANTLTGNTITVSNAVVSSNSFTLGASSLTTNGYARLPNGLLMQWGYAAISTATTVVTFPATFSAIYSFTAIPHLVSTTVWTSAAPTTTSVTLDIGSNANVYWMAIGT